MFEHMHNHAAELIPELQEWNEGRGISLGVESARWPGGWSAELALVFEEWLLGWN